MRNDYFHFFSHRVLYYVVAKRYRRPFANWKISDPPSFDSP